MSNTEWKPDLSIRRIVCAANRHCDSGRIVCGPRHWDATMRAQVKEGEGFANWDQGFIDQFGLWLTREEAYAVAAEKGQIIKPLAHAVGYLFSENLY
jgi:hypothetical protein